MAASLAAMKTSLGCVMYFGPGIFDPLNSGKTIIYQGRKRLRKIPLESTKSRWRDTLTSPSSAVATENSQCHSRSNSHIDDVKYIVKGPSSASPKIISVTAGKDQCEVGDISQITYDMDGVVTHLPLARIDVKTVADAVRMKIGTAIGRSQNHHMAAGRDQQVGDQAKDEVDIDSEEVEDDETEAAAEAVAAQHRGEAAAEHLVSIVSSVPKKMQQFTTAVGQAFPKPCLPQLHFPQRIVLSASQAYFIMGFGIFLIAAAVAERWWWHFRLDSQGSSNFNIPEKGKDAWDETPQPPRVPAGVPPVTLIEDMRKKESVEWVNMVLGKVFKIYRTGLEIWLVGLLQPLIDNLKKPEYVKRVQVKQFFLGEEPLNVRSIERKTSRRANDLQYHVGLRYTGGARLLLEVPLTVGMVPITIPVGVRDLDVDAEIWVKLTMIPEEPWVGTLTWAFVSLPTIKLVLAPFRLVNLMAIPLLSSFLEKLLTEDLPTLFVQPNKNVVDLLKGKRLLGPLPSNFREGVGHWGGFAGELSITIIAARNLFVLPFGKTDPYVVLNLGQQVIRSKKNTDTSSVGPPGAPTWNQDFLLLVENPGSQHLSIRIRDFYGVNFTVGFGEVPLSMLQDAVPMDVWVALRSGLGSIVSRQRGELKLRLTYRSFVDDEDAEFGDDAMPSRAEPDGVITELSDVASRFVHEVEKTANYLEKKGVDAGRGFREEMGTTFAMLGSKEKVGQMAPTGNPAVVGHAAENGHPVTAQFAEQRGGRMTNGSDGAVPSRTPGEGIESVGPVGDSTAGLEELGEGKVEALAKNVGGEVEEDAKREVEHRIIEQWESGDSESEWQGDGAGKRKVQDSLTRLDWGGVMEGLFESSSKDGGGMRAQVARDREAIEEQRQLAREAGVSAKGLDKLEDSIVEGRKAGLRQRRKGSAGLALKELRRAVVDGRGLQGIKDVLTGKYVDEAQELVFSGEDMEIKKKLVAKQANKSTPAPNDSKVGITLDEVVKDVDSTGNGAFLRENTALVWLAVLAVVLILVALDVNLSNPLNP